MICRHCGKNPEYAPEEYTAAKHWYMKMKERERANKLEKDRLEFEKNEDPID